MRKSRARYSEIYKRKTGLYLSDGVQFRSKDGAFTRINIACPKATLMDGLERLKFGVDEFFKQ